MTSAGTNTSSPIACVFQFLHVSYLAEWAIGYLIWFVQTRKVSRFQVWNESRYIAIIAAKKFVEIRSNYLITSQTNSLLLILIRKRGPSHQYMVLGHSFFFTFPPQRCKWYQFCFPKANGPRAKIIPVWHWQSTSPMFRCEQVPWASFSLLLLL